MLKKQKDDYRNSSVEILRIICIFGIIMMHNNGYLLSVAKGLQIPFIVIINIFNFESSLLMLISSYYGNPYASRKRLLSLAFMVWFYNYAGILKIFIFDFHKLSEGGFEGIARKLFPLASGSSWFFSGYIFVYLCAPYIERIIDSLELRTFRRIVVFLLLFFSIIPTMIMVGPISETGKDIGSLLLFYILGRYIKKNVNFGNVSLVRMCLLAFFSVFLQIILNGAFIFFYQHILGKQGVVLPYSKDYSIFEILLSIALLGITTKIVFHNKIINYVGKRVSGILLAENIVFIPAMIIDQYQDMTIGIIYLIMALSVVLLVMAEGLFVEMLRKYLFTDLEKKLITFFVNKCKKCFGE